MSFSVPVASLDEYRDEVELLRSSCAAGEFRPSTTQLPPPTSSSSPSPTSSSVPLLPLPDIDLVLSFEPEVLLRIQAPTNDGLAANILLSAPAADGDAVNALKQIIQSRVEEGDFEQAAFKIYDLFLHLQGALSDGDVVIPSSRDAASSHIDQGKPEHQDGSSANSKEQSSANPTGVAMARCIFWSHHLKSTTKKKNIRAWCAELRVWGLTKPGYPAFLLFEGAEEDVEEMIRRVKDQNWHALSLRAHVKYTYQQSRHKGRRGRDPSSSSAANSEEGADEEALRACLLAQGHASNPPIDGSSTTSPSPTSTHPTTTATSTSTGTKLRPTVEEIDSISDLVHRLRAAGVPELEYTEALGLRTGSSTGT